MEADGGILIETGQQQRPDCARWWPCLDCGDVVPERSGRRSVGMEKSEMNKERLLAALDNSALALDTVEGGLVALGHNSLSANTAGSSAVTVGANAGATNTTGNNNTFIVFAGSG